MTVITTRREETEQHELVTPDHPGPLAERSICPMEKIADN
jgi:hypothetical protein